MSDALIFLACILMATLAVKMVIEVVETVKFHWRHKKW